MKVYKKFHFSCCVIAKGLPFLGVKSSLNVCVAVV